MGRSGPAIAIASRATSASVHVPLINFAVEEDLPIRLDPQLLRSRWPVASRPVGLCTPVRVGSAAWQRIEGVPIRAEGRLSDSIHVEIKECGHGRTRAAPVLHVGNDEFTDSTAHSLVFLPKYHDTIIRL